MPTNTTTPNFSQIKMTQTAYTENSVPYTKTNAGKIIGGTLGAIAGVAGSNENNSVPSNTFNAVAMTAIGTGIGAAVDYMINKHRENTANKLDYNA